MAGASALAGKVSDDLLAQFLKAHAEQVDLLDQLGHEMRGRLASLAASIDAQLDGR